MKKSQQTKLQSSQLEQYEFGKTLGQGNFGKVRLAKHKLSQQLVAIKIMYKERIMESEQLNIVTRQIAILKSISHPNTIKLYEIIETETELFLVMEYIETNLMEYIEHSHTRDEAEIAKILYQILAGIEYLHSLGIAHRDLKPSNILITKDKVVKIIDFGLSNMYKSGYRLRSPVGSPSYAAPELIQNKNYCPLEIDIWSYGIIMFVMLTGYLPFCHKNVNELYKLILSVKYQIPTHVTKLAQDLLKNILVIPASKRFKIKQIRTHPWMYYHTKNFQLPTEPNHKHKQELIFKILQIQGFAKKDVQSNIDKKKHNKMTALYHLYQRKDTSKLQKMGISQQKTNETTIVLKTPKKIIRKPGMITPRRTPRNRSAASNDKTTSSFDKNRSYQTYIKLQQKANVSSRISTSRTSKYIPLTDIKLRNSLGSITRYNFIKKINDNKMQSYFGPYSLQALFTQKVETLKAHILAFLKREKAVVDEIGIYKFEIIAKKQKFNLVVNCLNDVEGLLVLRVMGEAPEEMIQSLFYYTRKFQ